VLAIPKEAKSGYQKALKQLSDKGREKAVRHLEKAVEIAPQSGQMQGGITRIVEQGQRGR
jgi:hypothetical protein